MPGTYDPELRGFVTKGWGLEAITKLSTVAEGEFIHEIHWRKVHKYLLRNPECRPVKEALAAFNKHLKFANVPHRYGVDRNIDCIDPVTPGGTKLMKHQLSAIPNLLAGSMLLGDDMGMGKTVTMLAAWWALNCHYGPSVTGLCRYPLTVLAPSDSICDEWVIALEQHFGLKEGIVHVKGPMAKEVFREAKVIIIPYSRFWRESYCNPIERRVCPQSVLVYDEAHRLSDPGSRQHCFAWHLANKRPFRWLASGSEVQNTPLSYYGPYRLTTLSRLTAVQWLEMVYEQWSKKWKEGAIKDVHVLRKSFAIRRTKSDLGIRMPPLLEITRRVGLDDISSNIYQELQATASAEIQDLQGKEKTITLTHWFTVHLKLLQLCSLPMLIGESRVASTHKWAALLDIMEEAGKQKVIIWSHFPRAIDWIHQQLSALYCGGSALLGQRRGAKVHGKVSPDERDQIKRDFQAGEYDFLVANPACWAEGVNLTKATINVHWDYHPSRTRWVQSRQRSHRIGQTKPVTIINLCVRGSVEEKLIRWLDRKTELADLITGG